MFARLLFCFVLSGLPLTGAAAVEPVLDLGPIRLDASAQELRAWLSREGFQRTTSSNPDVEAYVRRLDPVAGQGVGFTPRGDRLDYVFFNQDGVRQPAEKTLSDIEEKYGAGDEPVTPARGFAQRIYRLDDGGVTGRMMWSVKRGFVGVELYADTYGSPAESALSAWAAERFRQWKLPLLFMAGAGLGLWLLLRSMPVRTREALADGLGTVLGPVLKLLEFFGSRVFALFFGLILVPLMVLSGCAVGAGASELGTSWWWAAAWIAGVILVFESQDSDEFRYVILADLVFVLTLAGVVLQMMWLGDDAATGVKLRELLPGQ